MARQWNGNRAFIIPIVLAFFIPMAAMARPGGGAGKGGGGMGRLVERLDLTDDQRTQISSIRDEQRPQMRQLRQEVRGAKQAFDQALFTEASSPEDLVRLHSTLVAAKTKMMQARFDHMMKIRSVLNAEQLGQLKSLMASRRGRHFRNHPGMQS